MRKKAFVIGANSKTLTNAESDAEKMRAALARVDFTVYNQSVADLDANGIKREMDAYFADLKPADLALFYFAGHSDRDKGEKGLVLKAGLKQDSQEVDELMAAEVVVSLKKCSARHKIVILDSCKSGAFQQAKNEFRLGENNDIKFAYYCACDAWSEVKDTNETIQGGLLTHFVTQYLAQTSKGLHTDDLQTYLRRQYNSLTSSVATYEEVFHSTVQSITIRPEPVDPDIYAGLTDFLETKAPDLCERYFDLYEEISRKYVLYDDFGRDESLWSEFIGFVDKKVELDENFTTLLSLIKENLPDCNKPNLQSIKIYFRIYVDVMLLHFIYDALAQGASKGTIDAVFFEKLIRNEYGYNEAHKKSHLWPKILNNHKTKSIELRKLLRSELNKPALSRSKKVLEDKFDAFLTDFKGGLSARRTELLDSDEYCELQEESKGKRLADSFMSLFSKLSETADTVRGAFSGEGNKLNEYLYNTPIEKPKTDKMAITIKKRS